LLAYGIDMRRLRRPGQEDGLLILLHVQVFFADRVTAIPIDINPVVMVKIRVAAHIDADAVIVARLHNRKNHREHEIVERPLRGQAFYQDIVVRI